MFEQRLTMITLGVADVGRARLFYERLGWSASSASQDGISFFQLGGLVLALYPQAELGADCGLDEPRPGGMTLAYNTRSRDEVEVMIEHARAAGARILRTPHETPWGGYVGYFADPDGHPWEVTFAPMFLPAADGGITLPPP